MNGQIARYETMANVFYADSDKLSKAIAAGKLLDNRLSNTYLKVTTDIHFDMSAYLSYFDYDKLSQLKNYTENSITYSKYLDKI